MAVRDTFTPRFIPWADKTFALLETRMALLAGYLQLWARTEHAWHPRRPHTEETIRAQITEITPYLIKVVLSVDQDAGLWLELTRDGKWAWLWPVLLNHREDIVRIIGGANPDSISIIPNPNLATERLEALVRAEMQHDPYGRGSWHEAF